MWWDKKYQLLAAKDSPDNSNPPVVAMLGRPISDPVVSTHYPLSPEKNERNSMLLGRSLVLKGELTGGEDLVIEGQFEGTINLQDHCLTVGPEAKVKAHIQASRVVVRGSVKGNISARDRIEIRKTGSVVGDLVGQGIAIEEGAYFKGSIEILRPEPRKELPALSPQSVGVSVD